MKTIIWDYNGTILDDAALSVAIENEMLTERGYPAGYTLKDYRNMYSMPMEEYYRKLGYTFEDETFEETSAEYMRRYDKAFPGLSLCEGVEEKLALSASLGYTNVILSSCEHEMLQRQCKELGITPYFDVIMGVNNLVGGSKIGIGKKWMLEKGVRPEDCLYFGDTLADLHTARELQIQHLTLIASGHQSYERLAKAHENVVHSLHEVSL